MSAAVELDETAQVSRRSVKQVAPDRAEVTDVTVTVRKRSVRLRRSNPSMPGLTRRRVGDDFEFLGPDGEPVTDPETLERVRALVLPPAWEDVWICPWPNGHLQAIGTDSAGRRQYRYHDRWTARRDAEKFERAVQLGLVLPDLRRKLAEDLAGSGLTRERVLSCAVRLIDLGLFRIGSEEYARDNDSYGLATLRRDHVRVRGDEVRFSYPAKSGVEGSQRLRDPVVRDLVRALKRRRDPNPELMGWWSPSQRRWYDVRSAHVNEHLRELTGLDVTAKDFRTWHATVFFATTLARAPQGQKVTARRRTVAAAYRAVSEALGNTPAVAKKSYVHPRLVDLFEHGTTIDAAPEDGAASIEIVTDEASLAVARLLSPS